MLRSLGDGPYVVASPGCMYVLKSRIGISPGQPGRKDNRRMYKEKSHFHQEGKEEENALEVYGDCNLKSSVLANTMYVFFNTMANTEYVCGHMLCIYIYIWLYMFLC